MLCQWMLECQIFCCKFLYQIWFSVLLLRSYAMLDSAGGGNDTFLLRCCFLGACWMLWLAGGADCGICPVHSMVALPVAENIFDDIMALKLYGELAWAAAPFAEGGSLLP
ncbi:hypothetical protein Nepgr_006681 [Nepenthes gracilis]|uniref:Uncharacterized protein n=1 Tax=Nepenthes gracilis TaxID=150966 RepID=A0AAD3S5P0_NEPGR|nr:hypothetical protein Nepgr_006681 [Nepenthes gracilis]